MNFITLKQKPAKIHDNPLPEDYFLYLMVFIAYSAVFVGCITRWSGGSEDAAILAAGKILGIAIAAALILGRFTKSMMKKQLADEVAQHYASEISNTEYAQFRELSEQNAQIKEWVSDILRKNQKLTYADAEALQSKINAYMDGANKRELLNMA